MQYFINASTTACSYCTVNYSCANVDFSVLVCRWFLERCLTPSLTSSCGSTWVTPGTTFTPLSLQRLRRCCRTSIWSCANRTRRPTAHPSPPASWSPSSDSQRWEIQTTLIDLKCTLFIWCTAEFSASLLQSSESHDLQNHSNMLICCSRNIYDYCQCWKCLYNCGNHEFK